MAEHYDDPVVAAQPFASWDVVWRYLASRSERPMLILDELPYLAEADPAFPSVLQAGWDELLKPRGARLYVCGSSIAMMERIALDARAPLYGRRTGQWRVLPLKPWDLADAFERPFPDLIRMYAVFGGVPQYLQLVEPRRSLGANIKRLALAKGSPLYEEVPFLLREELREPRVYFAILAAIAGGAHKFGELASKTGLDGPNITRYIAELVELGFVRRDVPITEPNPHKSRLGLYRVADPFTRFWFRFVYSNQDRLELGEADAVLKTNVAPELERFTAPIAEEIARDLLCETSERRQVPFEPVHRGRYWSSQVELDLVLLDATRTRAFVAEVKWARRPVGVELLDDLRKRVARVPELARMRVWYALVSSNGFARSSRPIAADERLIDLRHVRLA